MNGSHRASATPGPAVGSRDIAGPQGRVHIDDGGTGDLPVVFLHSAAGSTEHWRAQLDHLRASRRAVAIDLRGHGRSESPRNGDFKIASMAEDVASVVDALGLARFVLVGHSMGGAVAVSYAAAHPTRVAGLFLVDPAADGRQIPTEQADGMMRGLRSDAWVAAVWAYWSPMLQASTPAVRDRLRRDLESTSQAAVADPLEDLLRFDPVAALGRYHGPRFSLITAANESPASYQRLVSDLPFAKVDGSGHWIQLDRPDVLNARIDEFLAKIR